jgi:hypothetical protein
MRLLLDACPNARDERESEPRFAAIFALLVIVDCERVVRVATGQRG